jgi:hypothetical protein
MLATETCPTCGTARTGSFRFCRSCGLDYDPTGPIAAPAPPPILSSVPDVAAEAEADAPIGTVAAAPSAGPTAGVASDPQAATDVVVIKKQHLRLLLGAVVGGLVGSMIAGAVVVPVLGESLVVLGAVATVGIVVAGAWLGMRMARPSS